MTTAKKESKISQTRALDEANTVLHGLKNEPANGQQIGTQLCETYSVGPRKSILGELKGLMQSSGSTIDRRGLTAFLKTLLEGVKQNQADKFLTILLKVACANGEKWGPYCTSDLILWMIEPDKRLPKILTIPKLPTGLTVAFEGMANRDSASKSDLNRWCKLAQASMNCLEVEDQKFSPAESSRILNAASKLEVSILPTSFFSSVPSLILLSGRGSGSFLTSPIGQPFIPFFAGMRSKPELGPAHATSSSSTTEVVPSPKQRLDDLLGKVSGIFGELQSEFLEREEELQNKEIELAQQVKKLQQKIDNQISEMASLRTIHEEEIRTKQSEIEHLNVQKAAVEDAAKRLDADLKLTDENAAKNLVEQKSDLRTQIGRAIDGPVHSLVEDIQKALNGNPTSEDVEHIAISFDTLHRKLIRETDLIHKTRLDLN